MYCKFRKETDLFSCDRVCCVKLCEVNTVQSNYSYDYRPNSVALSKIAQQSDNGQDEVRTARNIVRNSIYFVDHPRSGVVYNISCV